MMRAILLLATLLMIQTQLFAWKMEADKITVLNTTGNTTTSITFRQTYDTTPLIFLLATDRGSDPATLRVKNVTTTGFDVYIVEPDGNDGPHARMTSVPYIAIEPGVHTLPDGTQIVAQSISTQAYRAKLLAGSSWDTVSLSGFSTTPAILAQIQTANSERVDTPVPSAVSRPWMSIALRGVSSTGFQIALERSETTLGTLNSNEEIAYLAIDSALSGSNHYFGSSTADRIWYESIRSTDTIAGWDNSAAGYNIAFSTAYPDPIAVATKNSRDGGDGGWLRRRSISSSSISLVVDEDLANDTERAHTTERAGVVIFSEPFDVEFIYNTTAAMSINELLYNEVTTGVNNDEFIELYVTSSGDLNGFVLTDQDTNFYRFSSLSVNVGDYVIVHLGTGVDSSAGSIHHLYKNSTTILNNNNDDVVLLKPAQDVSILADNTAFNAEPMDYVAYGRNSVGSNVDAIPVSMNLITLSYSYTFGTELTGAVNGESISLTPNAIDSDQARCWERTTSGNAGNNGCAGYIPTRATDATYLHSQTQSNTAMPNIILSKSALPTYDPVNATINPKAIPGSIIEYTIAARNEGAGAANNISIADKIPTDLKLCVTAIGQCQVAQYTDGSPNSTLSLGVIEYSDDNGTTFAYTPSPDIDGFDISVTDIRINLTGTFVASIGAPYPNFEIKLYTGIR